MEKIHLKVKSSNKKTEKGVRIHVNSSERNLRVNKGASRVQLDTPIFQRVNLDEKALDLYRKQDKKICLKPPPIKLNKSSKKGGSKKLENFRSPLQRKKGLTKSSISNSQGRYNLDIFKEKKVDLREIIISRSLLIRAS
jgi:hypothetical protein